MHGNQQRTSTETLQKIVVRTLIKYSFFYKYPHIHRNRCTKGGTNLFDISFQDQLDANILYNKLIQTDSKSVHALSLNKETMTISIFDENWCQQTFIPVLKWFIQSKKETNWIVSVLENTFYFKDIEEQEQILCIYQSIRKGEINDIPNLPESEQREEELQAVLESLIYSKISFSIDSLITFRLKHYFDQLMPYIEAAIDEYKLEQEYQAFIQQLREVLFCTDSTMDEVHLVYNYQFKFFDRNGILISKNQLIKFINRTHFNNYGYYIDSVVLAPLVSIAPKKLYLYTDHSDHYLVQTIRNIFQERATLLPYQQFQMKKWKVN